MFEAIQSSYELLLPLIDSGEKIRVFVEADDSLEEGVGEHTSAEGFGDRAQMQAMLVLVKTQLLICRRYERAMSRYKYPAYRVLLGCIKLPSSCQEALGDGDSTTLLNTSLVKPKRAEFVQTSVELLYRTCLVSPLNSEELVAESGVVLLVSLLDFYTKVLVTLSEVTQGDRMKSIDDVASPEVILGIISHVVHTLAGVAYFESGRAAIESSEVLSPFLFNWRHCVDGRLVAGLKGKLSDNMIRRFALEGIANMAKNKSLQEHLVGCGMIWPLVRLMLRYDPTLEDRQSSQDDLDETGMSVISSNTQARLAVRALGMLSGALEEAPRNEAVTLGLVSLLTAPIALMLRNKRTSEILRILNANVEKANIIWNVTMRDQLEALLTKVGKERPEGASLTPNEELKPITEFTYEALKGELCICGVYIRVFNKDGKDALSCVPNLPRFTKAVVEFVAKSMNRSDIGNGWTKIPMEDTPHVHAIEDSITEPVDIHDPAFLLSVNALQTLIRVDGLFEELLAEASSIVPWVLLSLLELPLQSEVCLFLCCRAYFCDLRHVYCCLTIQFARRLQNRHLRLAVIC
jgi:hypothetical protein